MNIVVFGANGPTGLEVCRQALAAGYHITAAVRRPDEFQLKDKSLNVVKANAVLSTLGTPYSHNEIRLYSVSTKAIVEAMRASDSCRRLVVVSSGLTGRNLPKVRGFIQRNVVVPILRNVIGRTVYEDMFRMENYLETCTNIEWTVIRPWRLISVSGVSNYRLAEDFTVGNFTTRPDLAAAMLAELGTNGHIHKKMALITG